MGSPNAALATLLFFEAPRLCSRAANLQRGSRLLRQDHKVMSASRSQADIGAALAHVSDGPFAEGRHCPAPVWSAIVGPLTNRNQIAVIEGRFDRSCTMDWPDYLRDQATMYRQQAEQADDPFVKIELLELASVCEEVANNIEDRQTAG
jgi:hypothetical protein